MEKSNSDKTTQSNDTDEYYHQLAIDRLKAALKDPKTTISDIGYLLPFGVNLQTVPQLKALAPAIMRLAVRAAVDETISGDAEAWLIKDHRSPLERMGLTMPNPSVTAMMKPRLQDIKAVFESLRNSKQFLKITELIDELEKWGMNLSEFSPNAKEAFASVKRQIELGRYQFALADIEYFRKRGIDHPGFSVIIKNYKDRDAEWGVFESAKPASHDKKQDLLADIEMMIDDDNPYEALGLINDNELNLKNTPELRVLLPKLFEGVSHIIVSTTLDISPKTYMLEELRQMLYEMGVNLPNSTIIRLIDISKHHIAKGLMVLAENSLLGDSSDLDVMLELIDELERWDLYPWKYLPRDKKKAMGLLTKMIKNEFPMYAVEYVESLRSEGVNFPELQAVERMAKNELTESTKPIGVNDIDEVLAEIAMAVHDRKATEALDIIEEFNLTLDNTPQLEDFLESLIDLVAYEVYDEIKIGDSVMPIEKMRYQLASMGFILPNYLLTGAMKRYRADMDGVLAKRTADPRLTQDTLDFIMELGEWGIDMRKHIPTNKKALMAMLLQFVKVGNPTVADEYIRYLRRNKIDFPEFDSLKQMMLKESKDELQGKISVMRSGLDAVRKNPEANIYPLNILEVLKNMIASGTASQSDVVNALDEIKDKIVPYLVKQAKVRSNRWDVRLMIRELKQIGVEWAEVDIISRSIDDV